MSSVAAKDKVLAELKKMKIAQGAYTVISQPGDYLLVNNTILSYLTEELGLSGIYASLNKPCGILSRELKEEKINTKKLFFIDGTGEKNSQDIGNCIALQSSKSLTELSLAITEISKNKAAQFIFFDSLSTFLVYNSQEIVERFIHYIVTKSKNLGLFMVLLSVEEERSNKLIPLLTQICDGCIKI